MEKEKILKNFKIISHLSLLIGYIILCVGIVFFTITSEAVFFNLHAVRAILGMSLIILPLSAILLLRKNTINKKRVIISAVLFLITFALFLYILLKSLVIDYFQPISLSTLTSTLLIIGVVIMIVSCIISLIIKNNNMVIAATSMLIVLMSSSLIWANCQDYKDFTNIESKTFLFSPNESGYATFRIPSIISVNRNKIINGESITNDPLYAFAEGRINNSKDKGDIDLVYKFSIDGGKTWSDVKALLTFGEEVGKYGNPTVVFNEDTGRLHMFYMKASASDNYHYQSYSCILKINEDFSIEVDTSSIKDISLKLDAGNENGGSDGVRSDTLMVGPGKGAFLSNGEKGVLVMPCSNDKNSFVVYSLDDGETWQNLNVENKVKTAGLGNECEATFVNGKLVMVLRENKGCSSFHKEQYQRFSVSDDYGKTWNKPVDSILKTPICMSSVATYNNNLIITFPDDFYTRANLTVGMYIDNHFITRKLYNGAAGYSCVTVDSDNNVYVLSEVGKVNYNENLVFLKVDMKTFN